MGQKLIRRTVPGVFHGRSPTVFSIEFELFQGGRFKGLVKDAAVPVTRDVDRARERVRSHWCAVSQRVERD